MAIPSLPPKLERRRVLLRHHLTHPVRLFFLAELANEDQGGVSPSTLDSAIDSLSQGGPNVFSLTGDDILSLLVIRNEMPKTTRLRDLLRVHSE